MRLLGFPARSSLVPSFVVIVFAWSLTTRLGPSSQLPATFSHFVRILSRHAVGSQRFVTSLSGALSRVLCYPFSGQIWSCLFFVPFIYCATRPLTPLVVEFWWVLLPSATALCFRLCDLVFVFILLCSLYFLPHVYYQTVCYARQRYTYPFLSPLPFDGPFYM